MGETKQKVIVVGGGFSGLSVAYFLVQEGFRVEIIERQKRWGGLLGTKENPKGLVEQAANAFLANRELEQVSEAIGVPLLSKKEEAKNRFISRKYKPVQWPLSFFGSLRLIWFLFRYLFFRKATKPRHYETLQDWGDKNMGREATQYLLAPALQGIYAIQPKHLSANLVLQFLYRKEKIPRGLMKGSVAPAEGMGQWIQGLKDYLLEHDCELSTGVHWDVGKKEVPVVIATDLQAAKEILMNCEDSRYQTLKDVQSLSLSSVTLHLTEDSDRFPSGFGCLFPKKEGMAAIGVLHNNHIFEGRSKGVISETWILNDESDTMSRMSQQELVDKILHDRERLGCKKTEVIESFCHQWPFSIPHYGIELERALQNINLAENNVFLVGNYLGQLGLSKILLGAKKTAQLVKEKGKWRNAESS